DVLDAAVSSFRSTSHVALLSGEDEPKNTQLKNALNCYRSADVGQIDDAATVTYTCGSAGKSSVVISPDLVNEVAGDGKIILVETRLKFTSAFTFFIKNAIDLDGSSFFIPRLDSELSLPASQNC
ncbi:MAG: hypothetical protein JXQ99_14545, partial [Hyphomicrobiaceae bacterium]